MVFFNWATMQMAAKIVYYGPGLCGKTSNLSYIYAKTSPNSRGEMVSLETESDRTLFFDLLPIEVGTIGGFKTRLQLYTVPGQVFYNTTRKLVLKGVDGLVFVADSQRPMREANIESFRSLAENIEELGLGIDDLPLVLQYNKRDLQNVLSEEELNADLNPDGEYAFHVASAINGEGVFETLKEITKITLRKLRKRMASPQTEVTSRTPASPPQTPTSPPKTTGQRRSISAASLARAAEEGVGRGLYDEADSAPAPAAEVQPQPSTPAAEAEAGSVTEAQPQEATQVDAPVPLSETSAEEEAATTTPPTQETTDASATESSPPELGDEKPEDDAQGPPPSDSAPESAPEDDIGRDGDSETDHEEVWGDIPKTDNEPGAEFTPEHSPDSEFEADSAAAPSYQADSDGADFDDEVEVLEFEEPEPDGDPAFDPNAEYKGREDEVDLLEIDEADQESDLAPVKDDESPSPEETTAPSLPDSEFDTPEDEIDTPEAVEDEAPPEALAESTSIDGEEDEVEFDTSSGQESSIEPPPMKRVQISNQTDILAELDGLRREATEAAADRRRRVSQTADLDLDSLLSGKSANTRDLKRRIEQSLNSNIFKQMRSVELAFRIQDNQGSTIHTLEPISLDVDDASALQKLVLQLTVDLENVR